MKNDIEKIIQEGNQYIMSTYNRIPVAFVEGKGCYLIDTEGKKYLDMLGGLAVNGLGHCHENVVNAIKEQAEKLMHVSNLYWIKNQIELAKILVENSFGDRAFFCNSGAEANEAAIKLARKYSYKKYNENRSEIIAMTGSFHGRTLGTLAVTDSQKYREGYGPIPEGFKFAEFNNLDSLKAAISKNTCAIIMEPVQGEGGVTAADEEYMKAVRFICDEMDILLIADEVQCGIGRTGKLFAYENYGIEPDIMTLAKALAGGFPIGAVVAKDKFASAWYFGDHGTTFGGNPLACSAGVAAMTTIIEEKLWEKAAEMGNYFAKQLNTLVDKYSFVKKVKGKGLITGLELEVEGASIVKRMFDQGILINCTAGKVLRFLPPMVVGKEEIDITVNTLDSILKEMEETK